MSYDLDEAAVRRLAAEAIARHPDLSGRYVGLAIGTTDPLADVARTVERQVFEESFGNDTVTMITEYERYENDSLFFLVLDRATGLPAATARMIDGGGKTLDEAPDHIGTDLAGIMAAHDMHEGRIWDFATLAVLPQYRDRSSLTVSTLLYRTFLNAGRRVGVRHMVAMLDRRAHRNLSLIGVRLVPMAGSEPFEYLGSTSTRAVYSPFDELVPAIGRQSRQLRRFGAPITGALWGRGLRRVVTRQVAARASGRLASGRGLDESIELPGLERRQGNRRRGVDRRRVNLGVSPTGVERRRVSDIGHPAPVDRRQRPGEAERRLGTERVRRRRLFGWG